jgi:RNA polymerase sigma-70 factor (ECF subfamily)
MALLPDTRHSLLVRLSVPADADAWTEFLEVYETAVLQYCRSRGLQEADARDVMQEVLLAVHRSMDEWRPTGRPGGFRAWLMRTSHNICLKTLRAQGHKRCGVGGTSIQNIFNNVSERSPSQADDAEWERWAFYWAANEVEREVQPATWQAFVLTAVDGVPPAEAAERMQMRVGSIYAAKCRVLSRIRKRVGEFSRVEP